MPVLRHRAAGGEPAEIVLQAVLGETQDIGNTELLTIGAAPPAERHIHLSGSGLLGIHAKILGSRVSTAYSFVLSGAKVQIGKRPLEGIRVLRHGDIIGLGTVELLYLDFVLHRLQSSSPLLSRECNLPGCDRGITLAAGQDAIVCPWCGGAYHETCWLKLEQCATRGCYPVRRMLLGEIAGDVKPSKVPKSAAESTWSCGSQCGVGLKPEEDVIHCPGTNCAASYHVACWLSMRGECPPCGFDILSLINRLVFRTIGGKTR